MQIGCNRKRSGDLTGDINCIGEYDPDILRVRHNRIWDGIGDVTLRLYLIRNRLVNLPRSGGTRLGSEQGGTRQ